MSVTLNLDLATTSSAQSVAETLREVAIGTGELPPETTVAELLSGADTASGMWTCVNAVNPPSWNSVRTDFGMDPTVSVEFALGKSGDVEAQLDHIVRLVAGVLAEVAGDAVLHRDFESVLLLRQGATVRISDRDDEWPASRLAAIGQPYSRAGLGFATT
jgi:hypothetical protein